MAGADTILIVDDEYSLVESLSDILGLEGYAIVSARNGRQALEVLERSKPSLILLDFMMPVMDGVQLMEELAQRKIDIPVVLMTAAPMGLPKDKQRWTALLVKPFELDELTTTIARILSARR